VEPLDDSIGERDLKAERLADTREHRGRQQLRCEARRCHERDAARNQAKGPCAGVSRLNLSLQWRRHGQMASAIR